jgi:hypothetical protein
MPGKGVLLDDPPRIADHLKDVGPESASPEHQVRCQEGKEEPQPPPVVGPEVPSVGEVIARDDNAVSRPYFIGGAQAADQIVECGRSVDDKGDSVLGNRLIERDALPGQRAADATGTPDRQDAEHEGYPPAERHLRQEPNGQSKGQN